MICISHLLSIDGIFQTGGHFHIFHLASLNQINKITVTNKLFRQVTKKLELCNLKGENAVN